VFLIKFYIRVQFSLLTHYDFFLNRHHHLLIESKIVKFRYWVGIWYD